MGCGLQQCQISNVRQEVTGTLGLGRCDGVGSTAQGPVVRMQFERSRYDKCFVLRSGLRRLNVTKRCGENDRGVDDVRCQLYPNTTSVSACTGIAYSIGACV